MFSLLIAIVAAYLLGSISTSIILAKVQGKADPRTQGSGNAGATNVLRNSGKKDAIIVLLGDALKGWVAIMLGKFLGLQHTALAIVAIAVIAGHVFPIFFKFKGGKGVATFLGTLLGISFICLIVAIVAWAATALLTKYASLASMVSVVLGSIACLFTANAGDFLPMLIAAGFVVWMHRSNIQRLHNGTENKINLKQRTS